MNKLLMTNYELSARGGSAFGGRMKAAIIILFAICYMLFASFAFAVEGVDVTRASLGARVVGMGGAYVGVADDVNSIFLNPAGVGLIGNWGITSMSTKLMETVDYKLVGGVFRTSYGMIGVGYLGTSSPAGYYADDAGNVDEGESLSYGNNVIFLSYGGDISGAMDLGDDMQGLSWGATLKLISEGLEGKGLDGATGSGYGVDVGALVRPTGYLSLGATARNLLGGVSWASGAQENLGGELKLGLSVKVLGEEGLYKLGKNEVNINFDGDIYGMENYPMAMHAGVEWKPIEMLYVRAGLDQQPTAYGEGGNLGLSNNLTAGLGLKLSGFSFDYAYRTDGNLTEMPTHYFSISYMAPAAKKAAKKDGIENMNTKIEDNKDANIDMNIEIKD